MKAAGQEICLALSGRISNQDSFAERNHLKGQAKREKQPSLLSNPQTASGLALLAGPDHQDGNSVCHWLKTGYDNEVTSPAT